MQQKKYLTLEQVIYIHQDQIDTYGGTHGIRDVRLLESALARPQSSFGGKDLYSSVYEKAAALMHSLTKNHPFVDGNKRTAVVCLLTFLEINGKSLRVPQKELEDMCVNVADDTVDLEDLKDWVKKNASCNDSD